MPAITKILLVEDNPADARLLREMLAAPSATWFEVSHCDTLEKAVQEISARPADVILLDLSLPDESGLDTLVKVRQAGISTPVVVLTGLADEDLATRAIQVGAQDYLVKGSVNANILERSIRYAIERHRAEERYRLLFERNLAGVYRMAIDGRILDCNPAFAHLLGYDSAEALRDTDVSEFQTDPPRDLVTERLLSNQALSSFEIQFQTREGQRIWVLANENLSGEGPSATIEGTVVDITELKQLEAQLRQAQKMDAVGRLAGGVAHDFNNLLTIISSYSDLVLDHVGVSDPLYEPLEEIKNAAARAASLTRQLLAFSRQQILVAHVLDLNAIVSNVESMLRRLIGDNIQLITKKDERLGRIKADSGQLEQVLLNLAINARDAMQEGGRLYIETSNVTVSSNSSSEGNPPPGRFVRLMVRDNGCGMDAATLARIFEPFFTTKEVGKGTGLGLATVYGIVRQSGGYITVDSSPGAGTTFNVYLPIVDEPLTATVPRRFAAAARGTETILLVEDDEGVRRLARRVLASRGYNVLEATHGKHAISLCKKHTGPIDLLVTDVTMPQMSGRELVQNLKGQYPNLRVLYISGHTDDANLRGLLRHTTNGAFLQKPFTPDLLAGRVRTLLDRKDTSSDEKLRAV